MIFLKKITANLFLTLIVSFETIDITAFHKIRLL
jgi:hypothetical protein